MRRDGYTLLEIMVVVFIVGLLATIVAPRLMGRTDEARVTAAVASMKGIEQALGLYRLDNGIYPTTSQGLEALVERPTAAPVPKAWRGYLPNLPRDPWDHAYVYVLETPERYSLRSLGADGVEGGDRLDADIDARAR